MEDFKGQKCPRCLSDNINYIAGHGVSASTETKKTFPITSGSFTCEDCSFVFQSDLYEKEKIITKR